NRLPQQLSRKVANTLYRLRANLLKKLSLRLPVGIVTRELFLFEGERISVVGYLRHVFGSCGRAVVEWALAEQEKITTWNSPFAQYGRTISRRWRSWLCGRGSRSSPQSVTSSGRRSTPFSTPTGGSVSARR